LPFLDTYQISEAKYGIYLTMWTLVTFIAFWVGLTAFSYGTSIPSGIYFNCIVIGFGVGALH